MNNYYNTVVHNIRVQSKGGAIGSDLIEEVTCIYMLLWDDEFIKRCKRAGVKVELYEQYVNEIFIVINWCKTVYLFCDPNKKVESVFPWKVFGTTNFNG